jgi:mono/diheme cytochrome c family protein
MSLLLTALVAAAQGAASPSISSGAFTEAQAKRGDEAYQTNCSSCHGSKLKATNPEALDLIGPEFLRWWDGKPLEDLFEKMRDTMPPTGPDSLGEKTYMDVLAFILSANGFPAGDRELVPETAKAIVFEKKP